MAHVKRRSDMDLEGAFLIEGLPGVGLVGKIATDHLIETFDMELYGTCHCEGLARIGIYHEDQRELEPPVRIYADEETGLAALQSDVPVDAEAISEFSACMTGWVESAGLTPIYLSGLPAKTDGKPAIYGVGTAGGVAMLDETDIPLPSENGVVSGPTGALLNRAVETGLDSVGLVVESDPKFPDPEAARVLIEDGICKLTGVDVDISELVERAEEIREQKERLARRMEEAKEEESSQAQPLRMYQ
ncbi:proteasome assembly chaperone family protein [Haloarchaeobius sp. HME9146]|uniref:proteasome assembly chaperone family protein n=1 Tax=Haloarchaeobius sp. HME9146 TaxID=2978732 RepID=UPI0021BF2F94|nr:PAC2 family protein [Haloarchaeobius sp. HME9146]MCT9096019.1 PAC2 family protein [Haloarchaeobius sp. HME9146]